MPPIRTSPLFLQHLSNDLIHKFVKNNLQKGKYKWVILTNDRSSDNQDIPTGNIVGLISPHLRSRSKGSLIFRSSLEKRLRRSPRFST